ncbi:MAG TPA: hypothetical protein VKG44_07665, partial [Candidatus Baltobacteraceae bacterium]|nr:hypothetical protein [Candidatus Baltobacteraceae bacterium]
MTHAPGQRPASRTIEIRADTIGFYSGVVVVGADGHVRILEGSREIDADYARYDFQHDRLLATGNVTVLTNLGSFSCAAYSHDRAAQTTYYISLDPEPRAMRFTGNDPSKAISAPPPSGIFDAYDLAGARPYFKGRHAVIIPHTNVRISPAEFPSGAGPSFEVPTYLQTVSTNPNIGVEAEPSASFDQPFNVFGSPGALTQIHLRYDTVTGAGIGIEQHLVDQIRSYLVVSALVIGVHREDLASYINAGSHVNANLTAYHTTTD